MTQLHKYLRYSKQGLQSFRPNFNHFNSRFFGSFRPVFHFILPDFSPAQRKNFSAGGLTGPSKSTVLRIVRKFLLLQQCKPCSAGLDGGLCARALSRPRPTMPLHLHVHAAQLNPEPWRGGSSEGRWQPERRVSEHRLHKPTREIPAPRDLQTQQDRLRPPPHPPQAEPTLQGLFGRRYRESELHALPALLQQRRESRRGGRRPGTASA